MTPSSLNGCRNWLRGLRVTDRPRVAIVCDGTTTKPHSPVIVAVYACDKDGTLLPIHSAVRGDGKQLVLPKSGLRAAEGQFDLPCPRRGCPYRLIDSTTAVTSALLRLGDSEVSLSRLEAELRHA